MKGSARVRGSRSIKSLLLAIVIPIIRFPECRVVPDTLLQTFPCIKKIDLTKKCYHEHQAAQVVRAPWPRTEMLRGSRVGYFCSPPATLVSSTQMSIPRRACDVWSAHYGPCSSLYNVIFSRRRQIYRIRLRLRGLE